MRKQLQGIALLLFGILLMMTAMIDPWIPILDGMSQGILMTAGFLSGICGVVFCFMVDEREPS